MDYLIQEKIEVFSAAELALHFGSVNTKVYVMLEDLVRRGWLTKLKKGLYARNPEEHRGRYYLPNWHKVAAGLAHPKKYYIGFYSALQIHDLITQPSLREYVVVQHRVYPKIMEIQGVPFELVHFKPERFFGYKKSWINDHDKVFCSDLEKTMIDCLYLPQHAGGMEGIVKALYKARKEIRPGVLVEYALTFKVQAVMKRLGYVLEKMNLFKTEQNILHQLVSESYTKLDPSVKVKGKFHRRWRIEDNVDLDDVAKTIET